MARSSKKKKLTYKLWDGDLLESYNSLEDAAERIPSYAAANPTLTDRVRLTAMLPSNQGAKIVLTVTGLDEILQYLEDSGLDVEEIEDELE